MLGDSLRRRHPPKQTVAAARPSTAPRGLRTWVRWLVAAVLVGAGSFGGGFLLATQVVFPKPETAGAGVAAPDLYGRDRADAEGAIRAAGLEVGSVTEMASTDARAGIVLAQDPVPGQELLPGAAVSFAVSSGFPAARVPPLTGLGANTARDLLERAGFDVEVQRIPDDELPQGVVVRTDPAAGTLSKLPGSVLLFVSAGPPPAVDSFAVQTPGGTWP